MRFSSSWRTNQRTFSANVVEGTSGRTPSKACLLAGGYIADIDWFFFKWCAWCFAELPFRSSWVYRRLEFDGYISGVFGASRSCQT